ncbi:MAG: V-type ATP synthase subunit D [Methylohalobius sp. ZOD2]
MPKLLNKSEMAKAQRRLKTYRRLLPPLDIKRKQLIQEKNKALRLVEITQEKMNSIRSKVDRNLPMLANREIDLTDLTKVKSIEMGEENLVGARLPVIRAMHMESTKYGFLTKPHWVDNAKKLLEAYLRLQIQQRVNEQRLALLEKAVIKATQRVNIIEKILIPETRQHIREILIHLDEIERASVIRAKITKRLKSVKSESDL